MADLRSDLRGENLVLNEAWRGDPAEGRLPARTCVGLADDALVETDLVVRRPA